MNRFQATTSLAAAALVMLGMGTAFAAGTTAETPKNESNEVVIIKQIRHSGEGDAKRDAETAMVHCGDAKPQIDTTDEARNDEGKIKRSRIVICSKGDADSASMIKHLEEARKQIEGVTELSSEAKAKTLAALDARIAKLQTKN
jgi:hypothetical protein